MKNIRTFELLNPNELFTFNNDGTKVKNNYTAHQIIEKIRDLYASQREKSSKLNLLGSQE